MPTLFIVGGLPGVGKSTLSRGLAGRRGAVHLRVDTIEHALRDAGRYAGGPEGYLVAGRLAADNLGLGLDVVADSVNALEVTRSAWRAAAEGVGAGFVEIEVVCSDPREHRRRVESRSSEIPGLRMPTWADVQHREYHPWDRPRRVVDTAGRSVEQSLDELLRAVEAELAASGPPPGR